MNKLKELIFGTLFLFLVLPLISASYTDFTKQKNITFTTTNDEILNNISTYLLINYDADMNNDFSDIQFYSTNLLTKYPYWIETKQDGINASLWIKLNNINQTILMVYGNSTIATESNISQTFLFADDFEDGDIDLNRWNQSFGVDWNETNGKLNTSTASGTVVFQFSPFSIKDAIVEWSSSPASGTSQMFTAIVTRLHYVSHTDGYNMAGVGYADVKVMIYNSFGTVLIANTGTASTYYTIGQYYRFRYIMNDTILNLTLLDDGTSIQGIDGTFGSGYFGLLSYEPASYEWVGVRTLISSEPTNSFSSEMNINEIPIVYPDVYVILNKPTASQIFNVTSIIFNCTIYDSEILNLTLVINGTDNLTITNSSGNLSLLSLEQTYTLENGVYTWGCYGYSVGKTNSSYGSFEVNYTIPAIPPTPPTPSPSYTDSPIYQIVSSVGVGIGILFQSIAIPLGILILMLSIISAIGFLVYSLAGELRTKFVVK